MNVHIRNYWLDTASPPSPSTGPPPERVDVAVIGAGYTGLSAAHWLASHGTRVVVLEAESIGWGASSRNGGMVLTGLKLGIDTLRARYGADAAYRMYATSLASIDYTEALILAGGIVCHFTRCGHVAVASTPAHFERAARAVDAMSREYASALRVVSRRELADEVGSEIYFGGVVDDRSGGLNPAQYVAGLARVAMDAGAEIYEDTRVTRIVHAPHQGQTDYDVVTTRGHVIAREVVIATGGYTDGAVPRLQRRILPIGSYIIATEPLSDELAHELSPRRRMIFDSRRLLHYYRLTPDNRMLFGGRAAFFPDTRRRIAESAAILRRDLIAVFPQLRRASINYAWGGTLDFCLDTMPHAGRLDGMSYALGYAGHGVAMSTYLGAQIAAQLSGEPAQHPFADIPFRGAPAGMHEALRRGLPIVAGWYKLRDWIDDVAAGTGGRRAGSMV